MHLTKNTYDVLVIGGGIHGACIFWEASLRGLSAALVEQNDFASAAASHQLSVVHGRSLGLRGDESGALRLPAHERVTLMRIAPHLVHSMPVLIPAYEGERGHQKLGLFVDRLLNFTRSASPDRDDFSAGGRVLSKRECLELLGDLPPQGLIGASLFQGAQVYSAERLILDYLKSAAQIGGELANYAKVVGFICENNRVIGAKLRDQISGQHFEVRAKLVVNSVGAWTTEMRQLFLSSDKTSADAGFVRGINIVTRLLFENFAVGLKASDHNSATYFIAPWQGHSVIGTSYSASAGMPEKGAVDPREIAGFLEQINQRYPAAKLTNEDVRYVHEGFFPDSSAASYLKANIPNGFVSIIDYQREGVGGILSIVGEAYSTARLAAVKVVDHIFAVWGHEQPVNSVSATSPLRGGEMQNFEQFLEQELAANSRKLSHSTLRKLIYSYGTEYVNVLKYFPVEPWDVTLQEEQRAVLSAQIHHAVFKEMALKLVDVVFRRTDLTFAAKPDRETLRFCADTMGKVLDWEDHRIEQELEEVNLRFAWNH